MSSFDILRQGKYVINRVRVDIRFVSMKGGYKMRTKAAIESIYGDIARQNGVTADEVKEEIRNALNMGIHSSDPEAKEFWKKITTDVENPTIDDIILYIVSGLTQNV